jgi:hypothetical protein
MGGASHCEPFHSHAPHPNPLPEGEGVRGYSALTVTITG